MKKIIIVLLAFCLQPLSSFGQNIEYQSHSGNKINLLKTEGENQYLAYYRVDGTQWNEQVKKVTKYEGDVNTKYIIKIPTGKKLRPFDMYQTVIDFKKSTLVAGTLVPTIEVYVLGGSQNGELFYQTNPTVDSEFIRSKLK